MTTQFDLEQQILSCWNVTTDINVLYRTVMDGDMTKDEIANVLLGITSLYNLKFNEMWGTFEKSNKEYYEAKNNERTN